MSKEPLHADALLPCSSQFFPAGGDLPFSRSCSRELKHQDEPSLDVLIAQVRQLPAGITTAELGTPSAPLTQQQLRCSSTSHGVATVSTGFSPDLLPLQQNVQQHPLPLQASVHTAGLLSLPSDSQHLSIAGTNAVRIVASSTPSEVALRESIGGGSRRSLQLQPLFVQDSSSQSPSKHLTVAVLPVVSCDNSKRQASSAPKSPEGQRQIRRLPSVAVGPSVAAEIRRFDSLQASRSANDLVAASPGLKSCTSISSDKRSPPQQLHQNQHSCGSPVIDNANFSNQPAETPGDKHQQLQDEVTRLTKVNSALEDLLHEARGALSEAQVQLAARQDHLRSLQSNLNEAQDGLVEMRASLAECQHAMTMLREELEAAQKEKADLTGQLEHMIAKAQAQEDQLEFTRQQLDARQQEFKANQDAASTAHSTNEQLQEQLKAAKDELNSTRRELAAVTSRLSSEAHDAKRAGDEASAFKRDIVQLQSDLSRSWQELCDAKERLRQVQAEADKRATQLDMQAADASQQLVVLKEHTAAQQAQIERLHNQLASVESDNTTLRSDVSSLLGSRQEAATLKEELHQLQLDSSRRIRELEADSSDALQQLLFMRSQNDRLSQLLQAAEGNAAALSADLENARLAAGSAHKSLREAQLQQQHMQQQFQLQLRQVQQNAHQQMQQLQERAQQHVDRMQQQHQSQMRQVQMQLQHQIDCARSEAAAAALRSSVDMMGMYPAGSQAAAAAPARGPRKLTFEDDLHLSIPGLSSPQQYKQQQLVSGSALPPRSNADNALDPVTDAFSGGAGVNSSYMPAGHSSPESVWQAENSAYWGPACLGTIGLASSGPAPGFAGGPASPDGKISPQTRNTSPTRGGAPAGRGVVAGATGGGMNSRGSAAPAAAAAEDSQQPWFAGGARPASGPSPGIRPGPQQQQQQQVRSSQQGPLATATQGSSPFGTEMTAQEIMVQSKQLEDQLLALCQEKDELNREYSKMPLGSGKTIKERQRKAAVEARLEEVAGMISKTRMALKRIVGR